MPRTHEYSSEKLQSAADALESDRVGHFDQQMTYLRNALAKVVSTTDSAKRQKIADSIQRIVDAAFVGQGVNL